MSPAPSLHRALQTAVAVLVLVAASATSAIAYDARVVWSPALGSSGYKVYVREGSGSYGTGTNVGTGTVNPDGTISFVLTGMNDLATNYFAVTSYNGAGAESGFSNEIAVSPAATATPIPTAT